MTKTEQRQQAKGECFNAIMRIYHPKSKWKGDPYDRESSYSEQRDYEVRSIVERYLNRLNKINRKPPCKTQ